MANQLTFSKDERYSIPQFIARTGNTGLDIIKSPKTNKHFMAGDSGRALGGVSDGVIASYANGEAITPVVSLVTTPEGSSFYLMHRQGEFTDNTIMSFRKDGSIR